jgi:hypothetical protein
MTPDQILAILDAATQPNARLNRVDYINIQRALEETAKRFKELEDMQKELST